MYDTGKYVGVDIGQTKMYLYAKEKEVCFEQKVPTGKDCKVETIREVIYDFIQTLPFSVKGIGIAMPGVVEKKGEKVLSSDIQSLSGITTDYLKKGDYKVKFINDVKAATINEAFLHPEKKTIAVMMCGTGLALGMVSDGKLYTGANGFAGELGYCVMPTEKGIVTIDSLVSGDSILKKARCEIGEFLQKLESSEKEAKKIIEEAGKNFGMAITMVEHVFNPDILIVGGSTVTYKGYLEEAIKIAKQYTIKEIFEACEIQRVSDFKKVVALGAIRYIQGEMII